MTFEPLFFLETLSMETYKYIKMFQVSKVYKTASKEGEKNVTSTKLKKYEN